MFSGNEIIPCKVQHREELKEERVHLCEQKPSDRTIEGLVHAPEDLKLVEYCDELEQDGIRTWNF